MMSPLIRRIAVLCISTTLLYLAFRQLTLGPDFPSPTDTSSSRIKGPIKWKDIPLRYTVASTIALPTGTPTAIPRIQHEFGAETQHNKAERLHRQAAVKEAFLHSWNGYKKYAWLQDEITPVTGGFTNGFGQRGATLVDALDTLAIMGLKEEFEGAVKAVKSIDFTTSAVPHLNVFETTIRHLGGLLSAYDVSEEKHRVLLDKATELGDMLYAAFDTKNRMPIGRWNWEKYVLLYTHQFSTNNFQCCFGPLSRSRRSDAQCRARLIDPRIHAPYPAHRRSKILRRRSAHNRAPDQTPRPHQDPRPLPHLRQPRARRLLRGQNIHNGRHVRLALRVLPKTAPAPQRSRSPVPQFLCQRYKRSKTTLLLPPPQPPERRHPHERLGAHQHRRLCQASPRGPAPCVFHRRHGRARSQDLQPHGRAGHSAEAGRRVYMGV